MGHPIVATAGHSSRSSREATSVTIPTVDYMLAGAVCWWAVIVKWSEVVAVGQNLWSISSQAGLQLLNVLVILTLSHRSFNYDTDHGRVWITLGDLYCGLETFMLGSRSEPMQSSITACSTGQSANDLHHRGDVPEVIVLPTHTIHINLELLAGGV